MKKHRIMVQMTTKQLEYIDAQAAEYQITRSEYVRRILDEHIQNAEKEKYTIDPAYYNNGRILNID